jgi:tRNA threonylcarbamoyladenosine biosynthesis protein TsaE
MTGEWHLADADATDRLGRALGGLLEPGDVVTLSGPLGSGKTSLARGALAAVGLTGEAASPSFPIVIAYDPPEVRLPVWHVDLYRIDDPAEIEELALGDARAMAALLIEWPDRGGSTWPDALSLSLAPKAGGGRRLTWQAGAAWGNRWPPARR